MQDVHPKGMGMNLGQTKKNLCLNAKKKQKKLIFNSGVCPEVKLGPLMDPSQNSSSQKQTLHKILPIKNRLSQNFSC